MKLVPFMEEWKDVKGFERYYEISNKGNLRRKGKSNFIKFRKNKDGYYLVNLCADGIRKTMQIHRIVAETFIPNPNSYPCVNHKDEDKNNNSVSNLEWCTVEYNNNYGKRENNKKRKVAQMDLPTGSILKIFPSILLASKEANINPGGISNVLKGKAKTAGGYFWKYLK